MIFRNPSKRIAFFTVIKWILVMVGSSTIIAMFFQGTYLFSSFQYYIKYASFGMSIGFTFWAGHYTIGKIIQKLNWTKNLKRANFISLLMYILFGLIVCPLLPYVYDRFWWNVSKDAIVMDVLVKGLMMFSMDMIAISMFYSTYLTKYWKESIEKNEELKRENLLAKFETLKNQVNPHFLFNSLNTLSGVVEQKPESAPDFIKKLSDIYRYVLEQKDKELASLQDEMKFVEDYLFLSKMRFGNALQFSSNLSAKNTIQVVPLGLQMLVENAIKHNIITNNKPLKIEINIDEHHIIVKNNIQRKNTIIAKKEALGLKNLKNRYEYLSNSSIEVINSDQEFIVKLPIIQA